ncbi:hypothetical protein AMTRI_Chr03g145490 [Amborella trichopoda]
MGADLDILVQVVFDVIRDNVKKARAKVKVAAGVSTNRREEVKDKRTTSNYVTSKEKEHASKPVCWSARVEARSIPTAACKPFACKVGPSAQFYIDGSLSAVNEGCYSFVP